VFSKEEKSPSTSRPDGIGIRRHTARKGRKTQVVHRWREKTVEVIVEKKKGKSERLARRSGKGELPVSERRSCHAEHGKSRVIIEREKHKCHEFAGANKKRHRHF